MKRLLTAIGIVAIGFTAQAQKNEIKSIEKAVKSSNYADAKSALKAAEGLISNMDDKTKAKFYYLKAQTLYANGNASDSDFDKAIETIDMLQKHESSTGKPKYSQLANDMKKSMLQTVLKQGDESFATKKYVDAAKQFDKAYRLSPQDTTYLYYAASAALNAKEYDLALSKYEELKKRRYTGIKTNYFATNKDTGEEELFANKESRDLSVKVAKTHIKPTDKKAESKYAEIVKYIALIYVNQGKKEKALAAIKDAKAEVPNDYNLLLSEGNIYLELGDKEKAFKLFKEALSMDKNNPDLNYNVGVMSMNAEDYEGASSYFKRALELKPNYADAALNLSTIQINQGNVINDQMNNLGTSAADNKKYEDLKSVKNEFFMGGVKILENYLSNNPNSKNIDIYTQIKNIYSALGDTAMYKKYKEKVDMLKASGL